MSASATLFAQFQANLNQYQQLSRDMVFQVAQQTFDHYFASHPAAPMIAPTVPMAGGAITNGKVKTIPVQWSRILNSKEYGLPAFFKAEHEALKQQTPGLNYFTAVSQLRTMFEDTPRWADYLTFVRGIHPSGASLKDPSPRKPKTGTTPVIQATTPVPGAPVAPQVPTAVPAAIPQPTVQPTVQLTVQPTVQVQPTAQPEPTSEAAATEDEKEAPCEHVHCVANA